MAKRSKESEGEAQPSLFGEELPTAALSKRQKRKARRLDAKSIVGDRSSIEPTEASPAGAVSGLLRFKDWAAKVFAEALHKAAVKGVTFLLWAVPLGVVVGFLAVLKIDLSEKIEPFWVYVDAMEKRYLSRTRPPTGEAQIETGSKTTAPLPSQVKPHTPQPWTVDVYPERK